jgi:uncharacterized protein with GYD domain
MPKYLIAGKYSAEGAKGVMKSGGSARKKVVSEALEKVGGKVESFYFAMGEDDVYLVVDAPDNTSALAASLAANAGGGAAVKTVVLITPEEMDAIAKKAAESTYTPPK